MYNYYQSDNDNLMQRFGVVVLCDTQYVLNFCPLILLCFDTIFPREKRTINVYGTTIWSNTVPTIWSTRYNVRIINNRIMCARKCCLS